MRIRAFIAFLFTSVAALAQLNPAVQVNPTNFVLTFPTNFFVANSNALLAVTGSGGGGDVTQEELTAGLAPKLNASGGTATNLTATGTSAFTGPITSASTITLSNQRIIGLAAPQGSADATTKLYVDGKFANTSLTGTTVAESVQVDQLISSLSANQDKFAFWDGDGVLTNKWSTTDITNLITQIASDIAGAGGTSSLTQYVPTDYYDASDGTINTNAVATKTASIQDAINAASAAYNSVTGARVTLVFQPGSIHINQITLKKNVIYKAAGEVVIWRATDYSGSDRGIFQTSRADGVQVFQTTGYVNAFDQWKSSPVDYSNADNWYGEGDNIRFSGPGKFILKVGDKALQQPPLYLQEVSNFYVEPGAIEVWHGTNTIQWGIAISGRNVFWNNPLVKNGSEIGQDGLHILSGRKMVFIGGLLESGDDSIAVGKQNDGGSNVGPDEACEDIAIIAPICESAKARAFVAYSGFNNLSVPWNEGNKVRRVSAIALSGHVAKNRQAGFYIGDFPDRGKIYSYTVTSAGSGYPNGYSKCPVSGGGGSGAECVIRVVGGQIVGAWPSYVSGTTWNNGSGYSSSGTVTLSGLASGSGGAVTANYQPYRNNLVEDIYVQGNIKIGGESHDGVNAYGVHLEGCRRITMDVGILAVQNSGTPVHRPLNMYAGENINLKLNLSGAWQKSGTINAGLFNGSTVDRVWIKGGSYIGTIDSGSAPFKLIGPIGTIAFLDNTFTDIRNGTYGILTFDQENSSQPFTYVTNLIVRGNVFTSYSASPSSTYGIGILNNTNTSAIGTLTMSGNDFTRITSFPAGSAMRSDVDHWHISGNPGYTVRNRTTATIGAGATTQVVTIGTATGFPDTTDEGIGCIRVTPVTTWGSASKWWVTPTSATTYTLNVDSAPGGSGLKFAIEEDTSLKE